MGAYALRRIQIAAESTKGTPATGYRVLTGIEGQIQDNSELDIRALEYYSGLMTGSAEGGAIFTSDVAEIALEGDFTTENAPYLLCAGWKDVSPTVSVGTATWVFPAPTTAANTPKTFTAETGDLTEQLRVAYGFITEWEISAKANEVTKYSGTMMARSVTAVSTGFSSATAVSSATTLPSNLWKVFYDASTATVGTTQLSATVREFSLKNKNGFHHKQFFDGVLYPTSDGQARPEVTLDMVLEQNANSITVRDDWKNKRKKRIRLLHGATSATFNSFLADLAGYWANVEKIDEDEGNTTLAVTFRCAPVGNATGDYCNFQVIDGLTGGL